MEEIAPKPVELPPFQSWLASNIPAVYDNTMSYYDELTSLIKWLETEVVPNVNSAIVLVNQLRNFVENYFDNLDVQEEINNKLDQMAEDGTLQEIITTYIQSNVAWTFDTVADMKAATNFVNGSYARTLGYYAVNDGGGALYYISNTGTANGMDIIAIGNTLYAHLQHTGTVYVKQLGAKGDGTTNDTAYFDRAFAIADHVIVNSTTNSYLITYLKVMEGKSIEGEALPYVKLDMQRGSSAVVPAAYDNTVIDKIYLNSLDTNLNNNRFDLRNNNITITNSRFEGFRSTSTANAWGLLLTGAKNVTIENCYFKNNTQSDIAIVGGTEDVIIRKCYGDSFHINFEPDGQDSVKNVKIDECNIAKLDLRINTNFLTTCQNITVTNCIIDLLEYDGAKAIFIDNIIKDIQNQGNGAGGEVKFINSLNMGKALINDVYIDNFTPSTSGTTEWFTQSMPSSIASCFSYDILNGYPVFTLNTNYTQRTTSIRHQDIEVSPTKTYLLRLNASADYTQGASNISTNTIIRQYDSDDEQIGDIAPSMFRGQTGTLVPMHEEIFIFKVSSDATKIRLILRNANYGKQKFMIRSVELYEISSNELNSNEIASPAIRTKRVFTGTTPSTGMNYKVGDTMYYAEPSTYIGKVCTAVTDYTATWKDFGAIPS